MSANNGNSITERISRLICESNQFPGYGENEDLYSVRSRNPVAYFGNDVIQAIRNHMGPHIQDSAGTPHPISPPYNPPLGFNILEWIPQSPNANLYNKPDAVFRFSKLSLDLLPWNLLINSKLETNFMECGISHVGFCHLMETIEKSSEGNSHRYLFRSGKISKIYNVGGLCIYSHYDPNEGESFQLNSCTVHYHYNDGTHKSVEVDVAGKSVVRFNDAFKGVQGGIHTLELENLESIEVEAEIDHSERANFIQVERMNPLVQPFYRIIRDHSYLFINGEINLFECLENIANECLDLPTYHERTDL